MEIATSQALFANHLPNAGMNMQRFRAVHDDDAMAAAAGSYIFYNCHCNVIANIKTQINSETLQPDTWKDRAEWMDGNDPISEYLIVEIVIS